MSTRASMSWCEETKLQSYCLYLEKMIIRSSQSNVFFSRHVSPQANMIVNLNLLRPEDLSVDDLIDDIGFALTNDG